MGIKQKFISDNEDPSGDQEGATIHRRTCLKMAGTALGLVSTTGAASDVVQAETSGYGRGGYGEGPYGDPTSLTVSTDTVSNLGSSSATLTGSLDDLGGASSIDCYFEWRQVGTNSWNSTTRQTLSSAESFSASIDSLSGSTTYEYRAVAQASDTDTDTGSTASFTTDSSNSGPSIDSYSVTEAGSPNPHIEITADWAVSDSNSNLDTVVVEILDSSGSLADATTTDVSGNSARDTDVIEIKHVDNQMFDVTLTVIDTHGASAEATQEVRE